jgi:hypothetical protein
MYPQIADISIMKLGAYAASIFKQAENRVLANPEHPASRVDRVAFH